jgi:hypothetical protein
MRLWTIHPQYLDSRGLVAAWREALLAQAVLAGKTEGYTRHPQLTRFRESQDPRSSIVDFLFELLHEAERRGFHFDRSRIAGMEGRSGARIPVGQGQVDYEWAFLRRKLERRSAAWLAALEPVGSPRLNRVFEAHEGGVEGWERQHGATEPGT